MKGKICMFAGHRRIQGDVTAATREAIRRLIVEDGVREFWCGAIGRFDWLCASLVRQMKREYRDIRLTLVRYGLGDPYTDLPENKLSLFDGVLIADLPEGEINMHPIIARNYWMVDRCDIVLACIQAPSGGAYTAVRYAAKKKKPLRFVGENPELTQRLR